MNPDYEILSFSDYKNENEFYTKDINGWWTNSLFYQPYTEKELLKRNYPIHSVKRGDGEIFTVGDEDEEFSKINSFYILNGELLVSAVRDIFNATGIRFSKLQKAKPKVPLFITEQISKLEEVFKKTINILLETKD